MINADYTTLQTPLRTIKGKVELADGSTAFSYTDALKSFKIERLGESGKFFGFGISQKLTVALIDKERAIELEDGARLKPYLAAADYYDNVFTVFMVKASETKRNENTNELTVVAYDALEAAAAHTFSEINIQPPYTMRDIAEAITSFLTDGKYGVITYGINPEPLDLEYEDGANLEGTETLREVLNAIAEATQTIYYIDEYNKSLIFKRLTDTTALTIDKSNYFELTSSEPVTLAAICSATELGDNITATGTATGVTQYVYNNPFWDLREDRAELVEAAIAAVDGATITQFSCNWRGNYYLEIGDSIELETKEGGTISSYLLNDVLEYNGALKQKTEWEYKQQEETASNPTTLGDTLKQTFAKVDKANKRIDMVVSENNANKDAIATLQINTQNISATVSEIESSTKEALEANSEDIANLKKSVSAQMTAEAVTVLVKNEIENGVTKVETTTGVTVDERGLTIDKSSSDLNTTISEDGMTIYKDNEESKPMLQANNSGVKAKNLHATTYLIIGNNSRFEDYGKRTGCFWLGGNS